MMDLPAAVYCAIVIMEVFVLGTATRKPNIVILLADDLGYGDLASYGNPSQEWNPIDELARDGLRFSQFYAGDSMCTPARAALMTGRYPIRLGMVGGRRVLFPTSTGGLPKEELTIPELMHHAGYRTGMAGKWHLGMNAYNRTDGSHLPHNHGFDYVGFNLPISNMWECDQTGIFNLEGPTAEAKMLAWCFLYNGSTIFQQPIRHRYLTHMLVDSFQHFLSTLGSAPFFFYFSFPQIHTSFYSTEFANSSKRGMLGDEINEMGWGVSQVRALLRKYHLDRHTLVLFLSDHGPQPELCLYGGYAGGLTGGKTTAFEGGIRVPAIAHWPGVITRTGEVSDALLSALDLLPSFAQLINVSLPADLILDGQNKLPLLLGDRSILDNDRPLFYYCNKQLVAVRYGNYKVHYYTTVMFNHSHAQATCPIGIPSNDWFVSQICSSRQLTAHTPPLIYHVVEDYLEEYPLRAALYSELLKTVDGFVRAHKASVRQVPDQLASFDENLIPCCNPPLCKCNFDDRRP